MLASSHPVPDASPARNAALPGYHMSRTPVPERPPGIEPLPNVPVTANPSVAARKALAKDIDKVWKFQTKSVTEMIETFSDSDKKHKTSITDLKKDLDKHIDSGAPKYDKTHRPHVGLG